MTRIFLFQIDAFTDRPFAGNPAAVCLLSEFKDDRWLQAVGQEMNLSETAFLLKEGDGYRLRWFTPKVEVDLCGHATLASAHVLWAEGHVSADNPILFHTKSGLLKAARKEALIELDFPTKPPVASSPPFGLLDALAVAAKYVGVGGDYRHCRIRCPYPCRPQVVRGVCNMGIVGMKSTAQGAC